MTDSRIDGFRPGVYVSEDAEVVDFAALYGVFSVARRYDPASDVFLVADEAFIDDVARIIEYTKAYEAYDDRETAEQSSR